MIIHKFIDSYKVKKKSENIQEIIMALLSKASTLLQLNARAFESTVIIKFNLCCFLNRYHKRNYQIDSFGFSSSSYNTRIIKIEKIRRLQMGKRSNFEI